MHVSDAVRRRKSVRQFLSTPVDDTTLRELLAGASRAPSGGNVQPWNVHVVNGAANLWEPHRSARFELGEAMYATLGIERDDKPGRLAQFARNGDLFGAPAALFCFVDRRMGRPQWSDLGMFLQTFMLLAVEAGLDTCAQEYWSVHHAAVREFCGAPDDHILFCGMAIGYADQSAPINALVSQRLALDDWAHFVP
jgi:nitroreductase